MVCNQVATMHPPKKKNDLFVAVVYIYIYMYTWNP